MAKDLSRNLLQLLDAIFSQFGETQANDLFYGFDVGRLGHDDKLNATGFSAGAGTGGIDGFLHVFYFCGNFCHKATKQGAKIRKSNPPLCMKTVKILS